MKALFVDTAGWMALADGSDPHHQDAREARDTWLSAGGLLISSDYVLDETLTLIRIRLGLPAASHWWDQVSASRRLRWEWMNANRAEQARRWFFQWQDKRLSFTDCSSFVIMRELGLTQALTTDRHFRQAGFVALPVG